MAWTELFQILFSQETMSENSQDTLVNNSQEDILSSKLEKTSLGTEDPENPLGDDTTKVIGIEVKGFMMACF